MALIYITDEAKKKLDKLVKLEKRTISKEIEMLIEDRHTVLSKNVVDCTAPAAPVQRNS